MDLVIQQNPDSGLLLQTARSWLTRSVTKHNLPSNDAYTEALVHGGTQLTDADGKLANASQLADIINSLATSTGHSCEVTAVEAARMRQMVHARGQAGYFAFEDEELYNGVFKTVQRDLSEYRTSISGPHQ